MTIRFVGGGMDDKRQAVTLSLPTELVTLLKIEAVRQRKPLYKLVEEMLIKEVSCESESQAVST